MRNRAIGLLVVVALGAGVATAAAQGPGLPSGPDAPPAPAAPAPAPVAPAPVAPAPAPVSPTPAPPPEPVGPTPEELAEQRRAEAAARRRAEARRRAAIARRRIAESRRTIEVAIGDGGAQAVRNAENAALALASEQAFVQRRNTSISATLLLAVALLVALGVVLAAAGFRRLGAARAEGWRGLGRQDTTGPSKAGRWTAGLGSLGSLKRGSSLERALAVGPPLEDADGESPSVAERPRRRPDEGSD